MPLVRKRSPFVSAVINAALFMCLFPQIGDAAQSNAPDKSDAAVSVLAKTTEVTMAVKDGSFRLGDVITRVAADGSVSLQKASFLTAIQGVFRPEALKALQDKLPGSEDVSIDAVNKAGLKAHYNDTDLEILIQPTVDQRPRGNITGSIASTPPSDIVQPAHISGFLNTRFGIAYQRAQTHDSAQFEFPAMLLDGATRWGDLVMEGEAQFNVDGTFARHATRFIYDLPEEAVRVSAGDIVLRPDGLFSSPPLLGVAIERSYSDLQPTLNIRPTGKGSFRIERPSEVRVLVNDREVRRLRLAPGEYDLNDLPLTSGTNNIRLVITDEFGKVETLDFSILFNRTLLRPGVSEWSIAAGTTADESGAEPNYDGGAPVLAGSLRAGLSDTLTGSLGLQLSDQARLAGVSVLRQTPIGLLNVDAAASVGADQVSGWSLGSELDLDAAQFSDQLGSIQLGTDFKSKGFKASLEDSAANSSTLRLHGSLTRLLPEGFSLALSGYYQLASFESDTKFGTSASLTRIIDNEVSLGLSGSYDSGSAGQLSDTELSGFSLFARLTYRPSFASNLTLQYDGVSRSTTASLASSFTSGATRANFDVDLAHNAQTESGSPEQVVGADLHLSDTRFEVNASRTKDFKGLGSEVYNDRTTLNVGTALAFADGEVAFGRPVRSSFAIVDTHKSLAESDVRLAPSQDTYQAESDGLGPLLISDIAPYTVSSLPYDIENAPVGYDFGSGAFNFFAPYKSGYDLTVGSDFAVTATGVLKDADGQPVALKSGTVSSSANGGKKIVIFTNAGGIFAAQGLNAGEWTIEMNDGQHTRYGVSIPPDAVGFVKLGDIRPTS